MTVVKIAPGKRGRVVIDLDSGQKIVVPRKLLGDLKIGVGDNLDDDIMADLVSASRDLIRRRILGIVSRREISSQELLRRMRREGFNPEDIEIVIDDLKKKDVVDDDRFVRALIHDWTMINPRGNHALITEIRRNGLDPERYQNLINERDEEALARRVM
ncbi:MAG TPA: hypothetical protein EYP24_05435, partial [bacterium (Candidatus Stahlbacteria)]|nr:hypothetical protein [Candidatus Stahlbacteria bacterium]